MAATTVARQHHLPKSDSARSTPSDKKQVKTEASTSTASKSSETNGTDTKPAATNADNAAPLAPPPKPTQSGGEGGDYFSGIHQGNSQAYTNEQNLFDSAFSKLPETPGGTQLPPVASLTSPAGQLTGNSTVGFNWGNGSLRSGPLSPAMLSGPAGGGEDYFSTNAIRGGFPTPNESSLRTGLTPGGGGSMFPPAPSPATQAMFNNLGSGFATPGTLDFHRTATNINANKKADPFTSTSATAQGTTATADPAAQASVSDQHDAANGLFMLAQAGTDQGAGYNQSQQDSNKRAMRANGSISNMSDVTQGRESLPSEEADQKPNTRNKGKKGGSAKNVRKAEETPSKQPPKKKGKSNTGSAQSVNQFDPEDDSDEDMKDEDDNGDVDGDGKDTRKMTDEEKRKNFLERNRVAALKCRQRKKQWLANLQAKVEIFSSENDALSAQVTQLREEILNLKTILIAHKDCPIALHQQQAGQYIPTQGPDYGGHPNPYGNFPQAGQVNQVPMGAGGPRRYS